MASQKCSGFILGLVVLALLPSCTDKADKVDVDKSTPQTAVPQTTAPQTKMSQSAVPVETLVDKQALFGDLHVHTMYSFDAFIFGTTASPDDAYEFAKGAPLRHPGGFDMQLKEPLDFYAVTDHAFYMGSLRAMADPSTDLSKHPLSKGMDTLDTAEQRLEKFQSIRKFLGSKDRFEILDKNVYKDAWDNIVASANRHNDPGKFTAFVAYEYTASGPQSENLHRNVIFNGDQAPALPFSRIDSANPEDLWQWMDKLRTEQGIESLAIPHNGNGSNGEMFKLLDFNGDPLDASYADLRMRNEPLVEITQVKGTSDTHPALSPNDEWADFEIMNYRIATWLDSKPDGSYVRQALMNGIELKENQGFNPFEFGIIGSSDTHNGSYAGDEDNYWSKVGLIDDEPVERGSIPLDVPLEDGSRYAKTYYKSWSASGLAGVWAEQNTRDSIYNAFRSKETFGTSGPRIKVRFFAGYDLPKIDDVDLISKSYAGGVAMGGDLMLTPGQGPSFILWASRDANSAPLQRLQVIKASIQGGKAVETVYDVACSNGGAVDPKTHRCPDNNARVDISDCSITADVGAGELKTRWTDPDFKASERAFYYVRVLENPTCRWSTWDAVRAGVAPNPELHSTIQERAWSSPIWFQPASAQ